MSRIFWIFWFAALIGAIVSSAKGQVADLYPVPPSYRVEGVPPIKKSEVAHLFYKPSEIKSNLIWDVDGANRRMLVTDTTNHVYLLGEPMAEPVRLFEKIIPSTIRFNPSGNLAVYATDFEDEDNYQLYVYDFKEKTSKRLVELTGKDESIDSFVWSKTGDAVFYVRSDYDQKTSKLCRFDFISEKCFEDSLKGSWTVIDSDSTKVLLKYWRAASSQHLYIYDIQAKRLTPVDEKGNNRKAFFAGGRTYWLSEGNEMCVKDPCILTVTNNKGGIEQLNLPQNLKNISDIKVSSKGGNILIQGTEDGIDYLRVFPLQGNKLGPEAPPFISGSYVIWHTRWLSDTELVYTLEDTSKPASIHSFDLTTNKVKNWTKERLPETLENKARRAEMFRWKSFDQKQIPGYIVRPQKSRGKSPVLIFVHGGPTVLDKPVFNLLDTVFVADLGVTIIHTNIRGSSGFGKSYLDADNEAKRVDAVTDIVSLLDWVKKQPDLDADKIYLRGQSYGGFIVLAAALQAPQRVKAVIAEYPLVSIRSFLSQSWIDETAKNEYGDPKNEDLMKKLDELSPVHDTSRWNKIPVFLTRGKNDARVPEREVIELKNQLQKSGTNVWFIYDSESGHGFSGDYVEAAMYQFLKKQITEERLK